MSKITANFSMSEFACKDGTPVPEILHKNIKLLARQLEVIRGSVKRPIYINSGYRTVSHNAKVGGASRSYHLTGRAADIWCEDLTPRELYSIINRLMVDGVIIAGGLKAYKTFVHYDIRGVSTRF